MDPIAILRQAALPDIVENALLAAIDGHIGARPSTEEAVLSNATAQILDLKFMLWRSTDRSNFDETSSRLCHDVVVDFQGIPSIRGRAAYREFPEGNLSALKQARGRHICFNPPITLINADHAQGVWGSSASGRIPGNRP